MTRLLIRRFVRDAGNTSDPVVRGQYGLLSSVVGIACNTALFAIKFIIGTVSGSVSIMADSINNLSDAGSSVVTLIGFRVAGKPADAAHPFGHARAEYIGGLVVSFMILLLGLEFFRTSLSRVLQPQPLDISLTALVVLALSILLKVWLWGFNRHVGKAIGSQALLATAQDSLNDTATTGMVLLATLLAKYAGLLLDGWMGLFVAVFIFISGLGIARDTMGPLLGQSPPDDLVQAIEKKVCSYPGILGAHDLMVHSYGPCNWFASLHAEVDARDALLQCHDLIDNIERDVLAELRVHLVIHTDPLVIGDPVLDELRQFTRGCVTDLDERFTMHDFRLVCGETHSNLIFDVSVPPECKTPNIQISRQIEERLRQRDPNFYAVITIDRSYVSDLVDHQKIIE